MSVYVQKEIFILFKKKSYWKKSIINLKTSEWEFFINPFIFSAATMTTETSNCCLKNFIYTPESLFQLLLFHKKWQEDMLTNVSQEEQYVFET